MHVRANARLTACSISNNLQRIDTLSWTTHLTECLQRLDENDEIIGDKILVTLIRLQLIVERVRSSQIQGAPLQASTMTEVVPPAFYARILQAELERVKEQISSRLSANGKDKSNVLCEKFTNCQSDLVSTYIYSTKLMIYEFALSNNENLAQIRNFDLLESRYMCLAALESYFKVFLTFGPSQYIGLPTPALLQVTHCLYCLNKLLSINDADWDRSAVIERVDLFEFCRQVVQGFKDAREAAGIVSDGPEHVFTRLSNAIDSARCYWESKLTVQVSIPEDAGDAQDVMHLGDFTAAPDEDMWLADFLGPVEWLQ